MLLPYKIVPVRHPCATCYNNIGNTSFKVGSGLLYGSGDGGGALGPNATIAILNNKKKSGLGCQLEE